MEEEKAVQQAEYAQRNDLYNAMQTFISFAD